MRTVINLDDDACVEVMELLGVRTKTDAVNAALRDILRRRRLRVLLESTAHIPVIEDPEAHYRAANR
ncbi:type II toxin-antitoxin system VapB family antitoxin [Catellatospora sp. KI3]|uniref:type II toxin-antitoxin system VapB family antitoxin n=1 Tax=Catellatospora sp. KI3 TaxID=3041620 RepID=UPI0024832595|nr:type II toxin-antitoxin system VapB family antitoxin [Catellatospora sp. KI3]MDI1464963.1 type II toxin-antitoxin system VapB family antitoxin [Catellatospora sp. KI3]